MQFDPHAFLNMDELSRLDMRPDQTKPSFACCFKSPKITDNKTGPTSFNFTSGTCCLDGGSEESETMGIMKKSSSPPPSPTAACANLRTAYHNCFNRWYSEKYVKGQWDKEECVSEWQKYKACLSEHLEEKHLSRFLEAEGPPFNSTIGADSTTASKSGTGPN